MDEQYTATVRVDQGNYTYDVGNSFEGAFRETLLALRSALRSRQNWLQVVFGKPSPPGSDPIAEIQIGPITVYHQSLLEDIYRSVLSVSEQLIRNNPLAARNRINREFNQPGRDFELIGTGSRNVITIDWHAVPAAGSSNGVRGSSSGTRRSIGNSSSFSRFRVAYDRESLSARVYEVLCVQKNINMIQELFRQDKRSDIELYNGQVVCDALQYRAYMNELNCFWVAVEVFFGISPVMQFVRDRLGETQTPGHLWYKYRAEGKRGAIQLTNELYQAQANVNRLVRTALEQLEPLIGRNHTSHVFMRDMIHFVDWARIELCMMDGALVENFQQVLDMARADARNMHRFMDQYFRKVSELQGEERGSGWVRRAGWVRIVRSKTTLRNGSSIIFPLGVSCQFQEVKHVEPMLDCKGDGRVAMRHIHFAKEIETGALAIRGREEGIDIETFLNQPLPLQRVIPVSNIRNVSALDDVMTESKLVALTTTGNALGGVRAKGVITSYQGFTDWAFAWIDTIEETLQETSKALQQISGIGEAQENQVKNTVVGIWKPFFDTFPKRMEILYEVMGDPDMRDLVAPGKPTNADASDVLQFLLSCLDEKKITAVVLHNAMLKPMVSRVSQLMQYVYDSNNVPVAASALPVDAKLQMFGLKLHIPGVGPSFGSVKLLTLGICHTKTFDPSPMIQVGFKDLIGKVAEKVRKAEPNRNRMEVRQTAEKLLSAHLKDRGVLMDAFEHFSTGTYKVNKKIDQYFGHTEPDELMHAFAVHATVSDQPIPQWHQLNAIKLEVEYDGQPEQWEAIESGKRLCKDLVEIDFCSHYPMIDMGAYNAFVHRDVFNMTAIFGGSQKNSLQQLDRGLPLISYIADFGKVWFCSRDCDWKALDELVPGRKLGRSSSFGMLYNDKRMILTSHVIHFCREIAVLKGIQSYDKDSMIALFKHIQFDILGLKEALLDFSVEHRAILHKYYYEVGCVIGKAGETPLGDEVSAWLRKMFVLPPMPVVAFPPCDSNGVVKRDDYIGPSNAHGTTGGSMMREKQRIIKHLNRHLPDELDSTWGEHVWGDAVEKEPRMVSIKKWYRNGIGKAKTGGRGAIQLEQHNTVLHDFEDDRNRARARSRLTDSVVRVRNSIKKRLEFVEWASSGGHFLMQEPLPMLPEYSIVGVGTVKATGQVNGLGEWRNMVLAISHMVMDRIVARVNVYRVQTDSVLIDPDDVQIVRSFLDAHYKVPMNEYEPEEIMLPGHIPLYREIRHTFVKDAMETKTARLFNHIVRGHLPQQERVNPSGAFHGEHAEIESALETMRVTWKETRDSQWFKQYVNLVAEGVPLSNGSRVPICDYLGVDRVAISGKDLHRLCWAKRADGEEHAEFFNELYRRFTQWSAEKLIGKGGCLMVGEPGAGKSTRVKSMMELLVDEAEQTSQELVEVDSATPQVFVKKVAYLAPMHSILRDFQEYQRVVEVATVDKFFGTRLSMEQLSLRAREHTRKYSKSLGPHLLEIMTIIADEIEATRKAVIPFLSEMKAMGKRLFLVGDPYQTTPSFGQAVHLDHDRIRGVCNNRKHVFDMQFRNSSVEQNDLLDSIISTGKVTGYLEDVMGPYLSVSLANDQSHGIRELDTTLQAIADACITQQTCQHTVSVQNYKVMGLLWVEINRRIMSHDSFKDNKDWVLLTRTGNSVLGDMSAEELQHVDDSGASNIGFLKAWTKLEYLLTGHSEISFRAFRNGPGGRNFLTGITLIMIPGMLYVPTEGFRSKYTLAASEDFGSEKKFQFYQQTRYRYVDCKEFTMTGVRMRNGKPHGPATVFQMRVFCMQECGSDEELWMTEAEAAKFLMPSYLILETFAVGATLDKFLVLNCHFNNPGYKSIRSTLQEHENMYGKNAVHTQKCRAIRVARTRVRNPQDSVIMDLQIPNQFFWRKFYFKQGRNFGHCEEKCIRESSRSRVEVKELFLKQQNQAGRMSMVITASNMELKRYCSSSDSAAQRFDITALNSASREVDDELLSGTTSFPSGKTFAQLYNPEPDEDEDTQPTELVTQDTFYSSQDSDMFDFPGNQAEYYAQRPAKRICVSSQS